MARLWRRTHLGSESDRATFRTLHSASLASPALREGLNRDSAERSAKHLRALLGTPALAITDTAGCLAWDGASGHHSDQVPALLSATLERGSHPQLRAQRPRLRRDRLSGADGDRQPAGRRRADRRHARGVRAVPDRGAGAGHRRGRHWVSGQLELAELDASRTRLAEAEVRALRAQISPHFIYNSLGAIASFVRTDPDRARELLLEFADFTRYSFRRHGDYTTLAEELRSIERYLLLEQARFGDRLQVTAARRAGGAAGRRPVPVHPAAGRERRPARARGGSTASATSPSPPATAARSA